MSWPPGEPARAELPCPSRFGPVTSCGHRSPVAHFATTIFFKKTPWNSTWWREVEVQPAVLPCVLTRRGVSATPPRMWPAAPLTVAVQGIKGQHLMCCVGRRQGERPKRPALPSPSTPRRRPGALWKFKKSYELQDDMYPLAPEPLHRSEYRHTTIRHHATTKITNPSAAVDPSTYSRWQEKPRAPG